MKKSLMIFACLLLVACHSNKSSTMTDSSTINEPPTATIQNIHPLIVGSVKKLGKPIANIKVILSSESCGSITAITDDEGKFKLEQNCKVSNAGPGNILDSPIYLFDIKISDSGKTLIWSTINPFDIKVDFDLTEHMVCTTSKQDNRCTNLVLDNSAVAK